MHARYCTGPAEADKLLTELYIQHGVTSSNFRSPSSRLLTEHERTILHICIVNVSITSFNLIKYLLQLPAEQLQKFKQKHYQR